MDRVRGELGVLLAHGFKSSLRTCLDWSSYVTHTLINHTPIAITQIGLNHHKRNVARTVVFDRPYNPSAFGYAVMLDHGNIRGAKPTLHKRSKSPRHAAKCDRKSKSVRKSHAEAA